MQHAPQLATPPPRRSLLPADGAGGGAAAVRRVLLVRRPEPDGGLELLFQGAFGDAFSWQNTLQRAAPLMLTALAVALPAQAGLTVIGGEGALVLGALGCAALPYVMPVPGGVVGIAMVLAGMLAGRAVGGPGRRAAPVAGRQRDDLQPAAGLHRHRAVQALRRRARCATRPASTSRRPAAGRGAAHRRIAPDSWRDVHWGLVIGIVACVLFGGWLSFTRRASRCAWSAATPAPRAWWACRRPAGGARVRAGRRVRGPRGRDRGGGGAEPRPTPRSIAGYGYTGILVSFVARHNPWAIPPVAILFGGYRRRGQPAAAPAGPARRVGAGAAGLRLRAASWAPRRCAAAAVPAADDAADLQPVEPGTGNMAIA